MKKERENEKPEQAISRQQDTSVNVTFPSELHVELVQANEVKGYEIFQWLTTIAAPVCAAFVTGYFLTDSTAGKDGLGLSAIAFGVMSAVFIYLAAQHRKRVFSNTIKKSIGLAEFRYPK